ncbi:transposon Tf2-6 polyprotein [Trichonephila clavipes]|nr:transposon Tf2-6 polyprotein [Trichonephila clavipes]
MGGTLNSRRAASPLVRLVEGEERLEVPDNPQVVLPLNWGETELNRSVTCMVLKATANDRENGFESPCFVRGTLCATCPGASWLCVVSSLIRALRSRTDTMVANVSGFSLPIVYLPLCLEETRYSDVRVARQHVSGITGAKRAFQRCKQALADAALLAHPSPSAPLALHVDASYYAIGGALHQVVDSELQPLAFFSRKLTSSEKKWPEAQPLKDITAETVAEAFFSSWVSRFGTPAILADRGRQFESSLFKAISKLLGVQKCRTTGYHPQANGMIRIAPPIEKCNQVPCY